MKFLQGLSLPNLIAGWKQTASEHDADGTNNPNPISLLTVMTEDEEENMCSEVHLPRNLVHKTDSNAATMTERYK